MLLRSVLVAISLCCDRPLRIVSFLAHKQRAFSVFSPDRLNQVKLCRVSEIVVLRAVAVTVRRKSRRRHCGNASRLVVLYEIFSVFLRVAYARQPVFRRVVRVCFCQTAVRFVFSAVSRFLRSVHTRVVIYAVFRRSGRFDGRNFVVHCRVFYRFVCVGVADCFFGQHTECVVSVRHDNAVFVDFAELSAL